PPAAATPAPWQCSAPAKAVSKRAIPSAEAPEDQSVRPPRSSPRKAPSSPADAAHSAPGQTSSCPPSHTPHPRLCRQSAVSSPPQNRLSYKEILHSPPPFPPTLLF